MWVREISLDLIDPNPQQPRRDFDEEELNELADSIREHGVLQPVLLQPNRLGTRYQLISGERRVRAAETAGLTKIPSLIHDPRDSESSMTVALVENIQRENLNDIELARAYRRLKDDYARTQEEIAQAVGKSRSAVANTFRLLELSEPMQQAISEGKITPGHARALLMVDAADREKLFDRVIKSGLSVRQAEKIAKDVTLGRKVEKIARKYHAMESESQVAGIVKDMERTLESSLGRKVKIERKSNGSGKITVEFYSDRDLESLVEGIRAKN